MFQALEATLVSLHKSLGEPSDTTLLLGAGPTLWVAYSGGVDSHALLDALVYINRSKPFYFKIKAVHVNHGLSECSDQWQQHCAKTCTNLGVEFCAQKLKIICKPKESLEAKARQARYGYFASVMAPGDFLFTAHHQQDQAETLLIQLLRGAGPKGLAAMPAQTDFADGAHIIRPLLNIAKGEVFDYAFKRSIDWVEDESNQNNQFARNYLRNDIVPMLEKRWPSAALTLSRSARLCAESAELLDEYAESLLQPCMVLALTEESGEFDKLLISELKKLSLKQQKLVLRYYLSKNKFALPSEVKLETLIDNIFYARPDRHPRVTWADIEVSRQKDYLNFNKINKKA